MRMPSVSNAVLNAIVARHGLRIDRPIVPVESAGVVHALWRLGSDLLLRVPKDEAMCLADHRCEAVAIPLASDAGVRTPRLVVFDDSLEMLPVPYSIVEYIRGENLTNLRPIDDHYRQTYEQLGEQLALLHRATVPSSAHPWLRVPGDSPAEALFDEVVAAGLLHVDGVAWLRDVCDRLDGVIVEAGSPPSVLLHNDIKPDNVMLDEAGHVHLIDWGDCGYGDPADDFHALPMRAIEPILRGYRLTEVGDPSLEARIVRVVVARSLSTLRRTPLLGPSWYRPIAATLFDLLTFAIDEPSTWNRWTSNESRGSRRGFLPVWNATEGGT
jgi:aminoglycoside phosphotransferase (APT) family kinase protein